MNDEEIASDTVGTANPDRDEFVELIADQAEQHGDLEPFEESADLELVPDDVEARVEAARVANEQEAARRQAWLEEEEARASRAAQEKAAEKLYRVVVDGEEKFLSEAQVLARASKHEAADKRLREAGEARRQAEQERQEAAALLQNAKAQVQPADPDEVFARQLQELPPGEAAKLLKQLRSNLVPKEQLQSVESKVANTLAFEAAGERVKREYGDILQDPIQRAAFLQLDAEALEEQRRTGQLEPYAVRHDRIASAVRARFGATQSLQDKAERKAATLTSLPVAHTRMMLPPEEDDSEPDVRETIAQMARGRGQPYAQR